MGSFAIFILSLTLGVLAWIIAKYQKQTLASHQMIMDRLDQISLQVRKYDPDHQELQNLKKKCEESLHTITAEIKQFKENQRKSHDTTRI